MSRVLLIQLRRSAALGAALIVLAAGIALLHDGSRGHGWMSLVITHRSSLLIGWPLAVAAGAWQARREHLAGVHELVESTARPRWSRILPVLTALAIAVSAAHVLVVLTAVPRLIDPTSYRPTAALTVVAGGALSVVAAAWLGMALGRLLSSAVTAPALGVAGIGLILAKSRVPDDQKWIYALFSPTGGNSYSFTDHVTVPSQVSTAQALWWLALALTAVVLLAAGSPRRRLAALLPLSLGAATLVVMPQDPVYPGYAVDTAAQQLVCADGTPRVCVSRVHAFMLPEVTPRAREGLAILARLPGAAPTEAIEDVTVWPDRGPVVLPDTVTTFPLQAGSEGSIFYDVLPMMLRAGGATNFCPEDTRADEAADAAATAWLLRQEPEPESRYFGTQHHDLWRTLDALDDGEAAVRVAALRDAKRTCSGDRSHLLTGSPA